jgi:hypothetical protein
MAGRNGRLCLDFVVALGGFTVNRSDTLSNWLVKGGVTVERGPGLWFISSRLPSSGKAVNFRSSSIFFNFNEEALKMKHFCLRISSQTSNPEIRIRRRRFGFFPSLLRRDILLTPLILWQMKTSWMRGCCR